MFVLVIRPNSGSQQCLCGDVKGAKQLPRSYNIVRDCGSGILTNLYDPKKAHKCWSVYMQVCQQFTRFGEVGAHRCPLFIDPLSLLRCLKVDENPAMEQLFARLAAERLALKNIDRSC